MANKTELPGSVGRGPSEPALGRYERGRRIASGGMGTVYLAYDRIAQRSVAYKQMSEDNERQRALRIAMFRREYETLAKLPHPNIVEVYDYGEEDGTPYYVMELLGGSDLTSRAPLTYRMACRLIRDIASALALVHTRCLVHRDVSPNNVRLGDDGAAKLLDFGALSPFGYAQTLVGTAAFIAPECFADGELDQRSDLYSLGAVAYWALTRNTPYPVHVFADVTDALYASPPPPPSAYVEDIPRELDELVLSMLARDPRGRPANASYIIERVTSIGNLRPESEERRVVQSYLEHPPLCGRTDTLTMLQTAVEQARHGGGGAWLIESEAGVGRSSVLAAIADHAQLHGWVVLRAQAHERSESFGLVRQLLEGARAIYPDLVDRALFEAPPERVRQDAVATAERHANMVEKTVATVRALSQRAPVLLVVDDVHWSDSESTTVLATLAALARELSLVIAMGCLALRSSNSGLAFAKLIASVKHVTLAPLTKDDIGELVQAVFGAVPNSLRVANWLYAQSGGNAAIALDYMRLLLQRRLVRYTLGTFIMPHEIELSLPEADAHRAALARVGDLSAEAETLAQMLSLHDGTLTHVELAAAAGLSRREEQVAIEELAHRGVIVRADDGCYIAGTSLRGAIQQALSDELRRTLHLSLARAFLDHAQHRVDHTFDASLHFLRAGKENEALALIVGAHSKVYGTTAVRHAPLLMDALAVALRQRRSKEACLSLMLPLTISGFWGNYAIQQRYIDTALSWMADVCGLTLARKLKPYVGGKLSLSIGLLYASVRLLRTPRSERLGQLIQMISYFVGLVCDSVAMAATLGDAMACQRFVGWLSPLAALPKHSAGWLLREFCLATTEAVRGRVDRGSARYAALLALLDKPVKGLEQAWSKLQLGSINGRGVCEAGLGNSLALSLASELGTDAFFAPHAEVIRLSYYAIRGDRENAELHRTRAEALALRGGTAWTASSTLSMLAAYAATLSEDPIALVRAMADLEQFSDYSAPFRAYRIICDGWLAHVRGHSKDALSRFEAVIYLDEAKSLPVVMVNWALFANVLNTLGQHDRAHAVCVEVLEDPERKGEKSVGKRLVARELAVAEAGLGRSADGFRRIEQQIAEALPFANPLELGASHRDCARIALLAGDAATFNMHFAKMEAYFGATHNPCLTRQCDTLLAKAEAAGLRAPRKRESRAAPMALLDDETAIDASSHARVSSWPGARK